MTPTVGPMPTALLSVFDKSGIVELAGGLHEAGWRLVSSGGTAAAVAQAGIPVTDVADLTGVPAILDHRVVTLHPRVHGGLLADPTNPAHVDDMQAHGIEAIDLVVVNLYPFESRPSIELIDIGGPAMVRAAAKNHAHVAVVVNPKDYAAVLREVRQAGTVSPATRRRLARDAFAAIAAYDAAIANWFDTETDGSLPQGLHLSLERAQTLRYGENPHQLGARYRLVGAQSWWDSAVQHQGKDLSYLNLYDAEAAWSLVHRFAQPACVIVKHANPCGVALGDDATAAYRRALDADPVSAFGGIVAVNRPIDAELAGLLTGLFLEVVVAPAADDGALEVLAARPNLRVLTGPPPVGAALDLRAIDGGLLVQTRDNVAPRSQQWSVVTQRQPSHREWSDLEFAWQVCASVSSNAIVFVNDGRTVGIGAGQQNRLDSADIAARRADGRARGGVCASDAFFPFADGLLAAAAAGVTAVVQPGGSVRDDEVIAAANAQGIAMVFTGQRHFRH